MIVAMIPGALGRCDNGHVFFYGLGAFLLTLGALARFRPRLLPVYAITFFVVFALAARVGGYLACACSSQMDDIFAALSGTPVDLSKVTGPLVADLKLDRYHSIAIPLNCDSATRRYVLDTHRLAVQYHPDLVTVRTFADLEREFQDLQRAEAVLAPAWVLELKGIPEDTFQQLLIAKRNGFNSLDRLTASLTFFRPVQLNPIRPTFEPNPLVARHLADHFVVLARSQNYLLLTHRSKANKRSTTSFATPASIGP